MNNCRIILQNPFKMFKPLLMLVFFLFLFSNSTVTGQKIEFQSTPLEGTSITAGASTNFSDDVCTINNGLYDCTNGYSVCEYQSFLQLHIPPLNEEDAPNYVVDKVYTVTVTYQIQYLDNGVVMSGLPEEISAEFTIDGGNFKNKMVKFYEFDYFLGVEVSDAVVTFLPEDETDPGDPSSPTVLLPTSASLSTGAFGYRYIPIDQSPNMNSIEITASDGYLYFDMPLIEGATSYDLEWTWIDDELKSGEEPKYDFKRNSTRINTYDPVYKVSNIYRNGVILARYRGVGHIDNGSANCDAEEKGAWNILTNAGKLSDDNVLDNQLDITNTHRVQFNWQHSRSYAEEGKFKDVINYFDGSLRSRQTVSKLESDNHVIATESIYDHVGRPVIQVLPSPVIVNDEYVNKIDFVPNLTNVHDPLGQNVVPYSYEHFEIENGGVVCGIPASALSTTSGASQYYSSANQVSGVGKEQDYVPDAGMFPFSQTIYTQDGTGRVRFQGGVGPTHQIFGGHETKYYYGVPSQNEIDRLFGIEAGYAKYYHKNLVVDPNGQVSVSYLDNKNRMIATALAGNSPLGITPLFDAETFLDKNNIVDLNNPISGLNGNKTLSISYPQLIEADGTEFSVEYKLDKLDFSFQECAPEICFDCVYSLQLNVTDDCGVFVLGSNDTLTINHMIDESKEDCQTSGSELFSIGFSAEPPLKVKSYNVNKVLTLDAFQMQEYEDIYIKYDTCILTLEEVLSSLLSDVDISTCGNYGDCPNVCLETLLEEPIENIEEFRAALLECIDNECEEIPVDPLEGGNICDDLLQGMLLDVSQFGLYGGISIDEEGYVEVEAVNNPQCLSVYYASNDFSTLVSTTAELPALYQNIDFKVYDEVSGVLTETPIVVEFMGQFVNPSELPLPIFLDYWKDSWAYSLIPYHPEYPSYLWCSQNMPPNDIYGALDFDLKIQNIETFAEANDLGYLRPSGMSSTAINSLVAGLDVSDNIGIDVEYDPIASSMPINLVYTFESDVDEVIYFSIYELAYLASIGNITDMESFLQGANEGLSIHNLSTQIGICDLDKYWVIFRDLYIQLARRPVLSADLNNFRENGPYENFNVILEKLGADCDCLEEMDDGMDCEDYEICTECPTFGIAKQRFSYFNGIEELDIQSIIDLDAPLEDQIDIINQTFEADIESTCETNCASYISEWEREYQNCADFSTNPDYATLFNVFKEICKLGCDVDHIMGTSTVPLESGGVPFTKPNGDVVNLYTFEEAHQVIIGLPLEECNALLIEAPFPYDADPFAGEMPIIDDCVCDKYNNIYDKFEQTGGNNFEEYLVSNCNYDPELYNIKDLFCVCRNPSEFISDTPINTGPIPPVFACKECVTCLQMFGIVDAFNDSEYGVLFSTEDGPLHENPYFRAVFTNWINKELNFNLTFIEYLDFLSYCGVSLSYNEISNFVELVDIVPQHMQQHNSGNGKGKPKSLSRSTLDGLVSVEVEVLPEAAEAGDGVTVMVTFNNLTEDLVENINLALLLPAGWGYVGTQPIGVPNPSGTNVSLLTASNITLEANESLEFVFTSNVPETIYLSRNYHFQASVTQGASDENPIIQEDAVFVEIPDPCLNGVENSEDLTLFLNEVFLIYKTMIENEDDPCDGIPLSLVPSYANSSINMLKYVDVLNQSVTVCTSDVDNEGDADDYTFIFLNTCTNEMNCDLVIYDIEDLDYLYDEADNEFKIKTIESAFNLDFTMEHELEVEYLDSRFNKVLVLEATSAECFPLIPCDRRILCNRSISIPLEENEDECVNSILDIAQMQANYLIAEEIEDSRATFRREYVSQCLNEENLNEQLFLAKDNLEYHHTLYYYDQSGSLVKTIPPKGVATMTPEAVANVQLARAIGTYDPSDATLYPVHTMPTKYKYNSFGQIDENKSPDLNVKTRYWYDKLGRPVLSQDGRQAQMIGHSYSYTLYDKLGRIIEVGELTHFESFDNFLTNLYPNAIYQEVSESDVVDYVESTNNRINIIRSIYDIDFEYIHNNELLSTDAKFDLTPGDNDIYKRKYLRKRISSSLFIEDLNNPYNYATHYDYDIHGNVKTILQEFRELEAVQHNIKRIDYKYDLISGNVHQVAYQEGHVDQFFHEYEYDADNRITLARTSKDGFIWDNDASYTYYDHGPLARTDLGQYNVQGCDYIYTIHVWIKAVNATNLNEENDPGNDGYDMPGLEHANVGNDAYAYSLHYYDEDYKGIDSEEADFAGSVPVGMNNLYNGNISKMNTALRGMDNMPLEITPNLYTYDQLHRIKSMQKFSPIDLSNGNFTWDGTLIDAYKTSYTYDPNGNLDSLKRQDAMGVFYDELKYTYAVGYPNRLINVDDNISNTADNNFQDQLGVNYFYDWSGNMKSDFIEGIDDITWDQYGKIRHIDRILGATPMLPELDYHYDAMGNRIVKVVDKGNEGKEYTFYVRDASGNVMAIYSGTEDPVKRNINTLFENEHHIYGSSRIGIKLSDMPMTDIANNSDDPSVSLERMRISGNRSYELSNHLGNVLSTVSDNKLLAGGPNVYQPEILSHSDYYPFGWAMPGRTESQLGHRYGFNGKEMDNDVKGDGVQYDYGFRIYDARIARFLSVDPLTKSYPMLTPYQFASNRPIDGIDLDGLEFMKKTSMIQFLGDPRNKQITAVDVGIKQLESWNLATFGSEFDVGLPGLYYQDNAKYNMSKQTRSNLMSANDGKNKQLSSELKELRLNMRMQEKAIKYGHKAAEKSFVSQANILTVISDAAVGSLKLYHLYKNHEDIEHGIESVKAVASSVELMQVVLDNKVLPNSITSNLSLLRGITNFLVDGTSIGSDQMHSDLIKKVGFALYSNRSAIMENRYSIRESTLGTACIGCDTEHPVFLPVFSMRSLDRASNEAQKAIDFYEGYLKDNPDTNASKVKQD